MSWKSICWDQTWPDIEQNRVECRRNKTCKKYYCKREKVLLKVVNFSGTQGLWSSQPECHLSRQETVRVRRESGHISLWSHQMMKVSSPWILPLRSLVPGSGGGCLVWCQLYPHCGSFHLVIIIENKEPSIVTWTMKAEQNAVYRSE